MASVFKPTVTRKLPGGGKSKRRTAFYWADYIDPVDGLQRRAALKLPSGRGITDKAVAGEELRKLLARLQRKAAGLIDPAIESAGLPVRVVIARFARHLRGLRRTPKHVQLSIVRIKDFCERGGIQRLADVNESNACKALRSLSATGRAPKTLNDIRAALFGLCQWAVKVERLIGRNPLDAVTKTETNGDIRKVRRALTPDEGARLLAAAGARALTYQTAMMTGLRWGELAALRWADLDLDGEAPAIVLRAATTKARRADTVLLRLDLADALRAARPPFARPSDRVFRSVPKYETFIRDCVRAGIVALDERGRQIPDERGRTVDRHALRTTFCTWLSTSGASPRTAQMLARHTDIRLTMQTYTDPKLLDGRSAVEALPDLSSGPERERSRATGTDDRPVDCGESVVVPVVPDVALPGLPSVPGGSQTGNLSISLSGRNSLADSRVSTSIPDNSYIRQNGGGGNRTRVP